MMDEQDSDTYLYQSLKVSVTSTSYNKRNNSKENVLHLKMKQKLNCLRLRNY